MKFLVDAQLPRRIVEWLNSVGCDAIHTIDLPAGNRTTDEQLIERASQDDRVVITKDADFVIEPFECHAGKIVVGFNRKY